MTTRSCLAAVIAIVAAFAGCECPGPEPTDAPRIAPAAPRLPVSSLPASGPRGVRFARTHLAIGELEAGVPAPVVIGSVSSPLTMVSDQAEIVSIDDVGRLVAHAQGRTTIRSIDQSSNLVVDVIVPRSLRIEPRTFRLGVNESARVRVLTDSGMVVPREAVTWWSSAFQVASVAGGAVRAGSVPGRATIEARFGGISAMAAVEVAGPPDVSFVLSPEEPRVRVGEVVSFEARSPDGPLDPEWSSEEQRVVTRLQANVFWAAAAGKTRVCARNGSRRVCTTVEVTP